MVLGFKEKFKDGKLTNFKNLILSGQKIHSMREGDRWRIGYSIEMATGVRTKAYNQFNKGIEGLSHCRGLQKVHMRYEDELLIIAVDGKPLTQHEMFMLVKNDGLYYERFIDWFFQNDSKEWKGQLIHWTDLKY